MTPNTVMLLAAFVTMCEGYLGILPTIELWGAFFYTKLGTSAKEKASQCGAFIAVRRPLVKNAFPVIKLSQSVKLWQKSYFYMENVDPAIDFINLPPYEADPPAEPRANWGYKPKPMLADATAAINRLRVLTEAKGLVASDLLVAFVERQVLPLQSRPHLICRMSEHRDPSQTCMRAKPSAEVSQLVNEITDLKLSEGSWQFGKRPYSRPHPPPAVSSRLFFLSWSFFFCRDLLCRLISRTCRSSSRPSR